MGCESTGRISLEVHSFGNVNGVELNQIYKFILIEKQLGGKMKRAKKICTLLLTMATVMAGMTVASFAGTDNEAKTSAIDVKAPEKVASEDAFWKGDYVYFGNYEKSPLKFRVLDPNSNDFGGNTILLDCDNALEQMPFNYDGKTKEWEKSDVRKLMNGSFYNVAFNDGEKQAIISSVKENPSTTDGKKSYDQEWVSLKGDKLFALDNMELENKSYGFGDYKNYNSRIKADKKAYWTRTYTTKNDVFDEKTYYYAMAITGNGQHYYVYVDSMGSEDTEEVYISPAMNVNRDQVLLTLPAMDSSETSESLNGENRDEINEWKLVLKDSAHEKFSAKFKSVSKGTLIADYADAVTGGKEYISAVVLNKEGHITYYGKLCKAEKASGEVQVKLPSAYNEEKGDQLYIFNEHCNGDKQTDYGSSLQMMEGHKCSNPEIKYIDNGDGTHRQECATCGYVAVSSEKHEVGTKATCAKKTICKKCDAEFGDIDQNNHENLQKVEAKEPTETDEGNIEYYYCDACGKYYKDAEAKEEIQQKDTILEKITKPEEPGKDDVNGGDDNNKEDNSGDVSKDEHKKTTVSKENGTHKNTTQKENTASNSPKTGDESNMLFFGICLALSMLTLAGIRVKMNRRS